MGFELTRLEISVGVISVSKKSGKTRQNAKAKIFAAVLIMERSQARKNNAKL
jgi:hypothetical protein